MPTITTYYLEMTERAALRPKRSDRRDLSLIRAELPCPELNRFLYTAVGGDWFWIDRLAWTYERWQKYLDRPELETWVLHAKGTPAGYFELEGQAEGNVEIVYFGLLPAYAGQGLGGYLLTAALERGFAMGARRVWVHTCTLDHSAALANYQARGMRLYKEERHDETLPAQSPGPWPGARSI